MNLQKSTRTQMAWPELLCVCVCVCVCLDLFNQKGVRKSSKVYICVWSYSSLLTVLRRRQWQATPVFLPGKSHGRRSLVGYSPWGREDSDSTEWLHFHFSLSFTGEENGNPLHILAWRIPGMGAWWAAVYWVAQSRTRLTWLSSSSLRKVCLYFLEVLV